MAFDYRGVSQHLRWIAPGAFRMGWPQHEWDEVHHQVSLSRGFWLGETAVTQALWRAVMGDDPSYFKDDGNPVERVSWEDVQWFIRRLNSADDTLGLRLPTEAEWEYACRAGTDTAFSFGDGITGDQANYNRHDPSEYGQKWAGGEQTVEVMALPVNPWGLYQMHGNVSEWCHDWYGAYSAGPVRDPVGSPTGRYRLIRGGSWFDAARNLRSARRGFRLPSTRNFTIGFRLACD